MLIAITCWYFRRKNDKSLRTDQYFVFVLSVYTLTFLLLATKMETAFRISYYFFIPSLMALCTMIRKLQFAIRGIIITGCILAFFGHHYISCSHDLEGALPYKSEILDIFIPKEPE